jgi:short-subunit dehydrogenase
MIAPPSKHVLVTGAGNQIGTEPAAEAAYRDLSAAALAHDLESK